MSKPARRTVEFADLDEVIAEVQRLHECGYARAGNWSLGQCCNHLAAGMNLTVDRYAYRFPPPISTANRFLFFKTFARDVVARLRLPTLPGFAQTEPVDDTEGLNRLVDSASRVLAAKPADLQPHPLFGRLTKEQWLTFHRFHAQRHLSFLVPAPASAEHNSTPAENTESAAVR